MLNTTKLYEVIADTMPMEGRDFTLDQVQQEGQPTRLVIKPLTAAGRGFVPTLMERLAKPMAEQGVTVVSDGVPEREVATIASIRAAVEREGAATVSAKLKAVGLEMHQKRAVADELVRKRMAAGGIAAARSPEEIKALKAADNARMALERLQHIADSLPQVRKEVDAAALVRAEAEGEAWAVDVNAPLTSLFERERVTRAIQDKELMIRQLAAMRYDEATLKRKAAMAAAQFIKERR